MQRNEYPKKSVINPIKRSVGDLYLNTGLNFRPASKAQSPMLVRKVFRLVASGALPFCVACILGAKSATMGQNIA